jgi:hypothetical protein
MGLFGLSEYTSHRIDCEVGRARLSVWYDDTVVRWRSPRPIRYGPIKTVYDVPPPPSLTTTPATSLGSDPPFALAAAKRAEVDAWRASLGPEHDWRVPGLHVRSDYVLLPSTRVARVSDNRYAVDAREWEVRVHGVLLMAVAFMPGIAWLTLALPAIVRDRRRARGACPRCGYDLRATPGQCRSADTASRRRRHRRQRRTALARGSIRRGAARLAVAATRR